jgi:AAA+ ATPase superfamily predicted ATPase
VSGFVNRARELAWLEHGWASGTPQLNILYGRLRVGKSALLDEFARGKRAVLHQAVEGTLADQLADLTAAILATEPDPVLRATPLASWDAAFGHLGRMAAAGPLLVILDEFQLTAEADPTLASRFQRWWSQTAVDLPIQVVLCGSSVRFFTRHLLGTLGSHETNASSLHLRPFSYRESAPFLADWSPADRVRAFAVAGGVPHYQLQLEPNRSLAWNIANKVLQRGAVLYHEAELLVREELREPRVYYSILRALSDGLSRVSDITARVRGADGGSDLTPYLSNLQELGLVAYRQPVVGGSVRRGIWTVEDPYVRFWFRFVLPFRSRLEHGADVDAFYAAAVAPALDQFVARPTFDEICRAWLREQVERGAWPGVEAVGAWWGAAPGPGKRTDAEVDVIGAAGKRVIVAGRTNWTREYVGFDALNYLRDVIRYVPGADDRTELVLFGRDFDHRLKRRADEERVRLVSAETLYA